MTRKRVVASNLTRAVAREDDTRELSCGHIHDSVFVRERLDRRSGEHFKAVRVRSVLVRDCQCEVS